MRWSVAATMLVPALALASPRPPSTNGVAFRPGDPHTIYVRTTFGLLISANDGCSFHWVCEQAIGYSGDFDPKLAVAADGTIYAGTYDGLRVSRDGGCSWTDAVGKKWVDAVAIAPDGDVWLATAETAAPSDVFRSTDGGHTFAPRGLRSANAWWKSVGIARDDPRRVYVSGYQVAPTPAAHLAVTDDAGATWQRRSLAGVAYGSTPLVLVRAVLGRDRVLVSSVGAAGVGDKLYLSSDAGATLREVLETSSPIRDVVEHAGAVYVATVAGSFASRDGGATFQPLTTGPHLACLGSNAGALVGCGGNWEPDSMALGRSPDGAAWSRALRFDQLAGPVACPAGTAVHDRCGPLWTSLRQQLQATAPACPVVAVPAPPPPARSRAWIAVVAAAAAALVIAAIAWRRRRLSRS